MLVKVLSDLILVFLLGRNKLQKYSKLVELSNLANMLHELYTFTQNGLLTFEILVQRNTVGTKHLEN